MNNKKNFSKIINRIPSKPIPNAATNSTNTIEELEINRELDNEIDRDDMSPIESMLRAAKSTGPKEVLIKLAVNRHLLLLQLSAVKIQTLYRQYQAIQRVDKIRKRISLFQQITKEISENWLEETILQTTLELSMSLIRDGLRYQEILLTIKEEISSQRDIILEELLHEIIPEIVHEICFDASDLYLSLSQSYHENKLLQSNQNNSQDTLRIHSNPILQCLFIMIDEIINPQIYILVKETILEVSNEWIDELHIPHVYNQLLDMILPEIIIETTFVWLFQGPKLCFTSEEIKEYFLNKQLQEKKRWELFAKRKEYERINQMPFLSSDFYTISDDLISSIVQQSVIHHSPKKKQELISEKVSEITNTLTT